MECLGSDPGKENSYNKYTKGRLGVKQRRSRRWFFPPEENKSYMGGFLVRSTHASNMRQRHGSLDAVFIHPSSVTYTGVVFLEYHHMVYYN
jgi:hypothetical protein